MPLLPLTHMDLKREARAFATSITHTPEPTLFGVTDGKAVGTFLEHKFQNHLRTRYQLQPGNSARGIDIPDLNVDLKATSVRQPQSSCPFQSARQKIFGLGYSLLIFVYDKIDNQDNHTATLNILHILFITSASTGDFTMTRRLRELVNEGVALPLS